MILETHSNSMKKRKTFLRANGATQRERWYALARRYVSIIAKRQRVNPRCRRCFEMRFCKSDMKSRPRFGCDGCVEMDDFFAECSALISGVEIVQRWVVL